VNSGIIYSGTKKKEELCWFAFGDYLRTTKLRESPGSMGTRDVEVEIEKIEDPKGDRLKGKLKWPYQTCKRRI
jgi:hypothetical protein